MATALSCPHQALEEFLAWEREQPERYERISGVIRMMTGGTLDHNRITLNVADELRQRRRGGDCEVFVNNVKVVTPAGDVMYPDVVVACGDLPGKATVLDAPVVIVEVLLESTAERDHGRKRWAYQTIPSLRHYVLVDQDEGGVEVTSRTRMAPGIASSCGILTTGFSCRRSKWRSVSSKCLPGSLSAGQRPERAPRTPRKPARSA